ncbi:MAG: hypothetical protein WD397_16340 [Wenzhouxiangellaceae bacterium]
MARLTPEVLPDEYHTVARPESFIAAIIDLDRNGAAKILDRQLLARNRAAQSGRLKLLVVHPVHTVVVNVYPETLCFARGRRPCRACQTRQQNQHD